MLITEKVGFECVDRLISARAKPENFFPSDELFQNLIWDIEDQIPAMLEAYGMRPTIKSIRDARLVFHREIEVLYFR